jgi:hypothetical protein
VGVGQRTGATYTIAEEGPERVLSTDESTESRPIHITVPVSIGGKRIFTEFYKATQNGQAMVDERAVVRR